MRLRLCNAGIPYRIRLELEPEHGRERAGAGRVLLDNSQQAIGRVLLQGI